MKSKGFRIVTHLFVVMFSLSCFTGAQLQAFESDEVNITIDQNGNKLAVWHTIDSGIGRIQASTLLHNSNTWSPPISISDPTKDSFWPLVQVDQKFRAIAVWITSDTTNGVNALMAAKKHSTGGWSPPVRLSGIDEHVESGFQMAISQDGHANVVWTTLLVSTGKHKIMSRKVKLSDFVWSPKAMLNP